MLQSVTLKNAAAADVIFNLKSIQGSTVTYMAPSSSITEPLTLTVDIVSKDLSSQASDRVSVRAQRVRKNATTGVPVATNASEQLVLPRDPVITDTDRKDCDAFVRSFITQAGVLDALLDGYLP